MFLACFFSPFSSFNDEKNKATKITLRESQLVTMVVNLNSGIKSHDQGESKLNTTLITNSDG